MKSLIQKVNFTASTDIIFNAIQKVSIFRKLYLIFSRKAYVLYTQKTFISLLVPVPNLEPLVAKAVIKSLIKEQKIIFPLIKNVDEKIKDKNQTENISKKQNQNQKTQESKDESSKNIKADYALKSSQTPLKLQLDKKYLQSLTNYYQHIEGYQINEQSRFLAIDNENNLFITNYKKPHVIQNEQQKTNQSQIKSESQSQSQSQSLLKQQQSTQLQQSKQKAVQQNKSAKNPQQKIQKISSSHLHQNYKYLALLTDSHKQQNKLQIQYVQNGYQYLFSKFLKIFVIANLFACFNILYKCTRYENHHMITESGKQQKNKYTKKQL